MWNSSDYNPVAPASECHYDFQAATPCTYDLVVPGLIPATPQKIEDLFTAMRSDLIRIIRNWEQSGQGEGGMDQEQDNADPEERGIPDRVEFPHHQQQEQEENDNDDINSVAVSSSLGAAGSSPQFGCLATRTTGSCAPEPSIFPSSGKAFLPLVFLGVG